MRVDRRRPSAIMAVVLMLAAGCGSTSEAGVGAGNAATGAAASGAAMAAADEASTSTMTAPTTAPPTTAPPTTALPTTAAEPVAVVVDETGTEAVIESIERIIPLDGQVAEVVFALGLGENVVATDLSATFPPEADALPEIGYQRALSTEPIAAFEPTVVLATEVAGPPEVIDELRRLGIPVVIVPNDASPTGPAGKIRAVAAALGVDDVGEELAGQTDDGVRAAIDRAAGAGDEAAAPRIAVLYVRGENTQLLLGTDSNVHWMVEAVGGVNIAEELGVEDSEPITAEAMLLADPEVIIVPSAGAASVGGIDGILSIPGLDRTSAANARRVFVYDDQLLLGNGPRTPSVLQQIIDDLEATR